MSFGHKLKLGAIALSASLMVLHLAHRDSIRVSSPSPHPVEAAVSPIYFAPDTNLEDVDLSLIEHSHRSIDVAMYTFTDHRIAEALRRAAKRGVLVRVYATGNSTSKSCGVIPPFLRCLPASLAST
jgi:phosphatidylserine/phosphatidylglycerophosphate/cardiolipin synthase-like enzyme